MKFLLLTMAPLLMAQPRTSPKIPDSPIHEPAAIVQ
jgi:hypothetical protein